MRAGPALSAALAAALVGTPALHAQAEPTCADGWSLRTATEGGRYCMVAGVSPGYAPGSWLGAESWLPADCDDPRRRCETQTRPIVDERFHDGVPIRLVTTARWFDKAGSASVFTIPDSGPGGPLFESGACSVISYGTPQNPPPPLERPGDSVLVFSLRIDCDVYWGDPQCPEGAWNAEQDACGPGVPEDPPPPPQQIQGTLTVNGAKTATLEPGQVGSFELAVRGATDARIVCEGEERHARSGLTPETWDQAAAAFSFATAGTYNCTLQGRRAVGQAAGQHTLALAPGGSAPPGPGNPRRAASDWTDLASVEVTVAAAPTFTACDGSLHDTQEAADAVTCPPPTFTACDGSLHHTQQAADAVLCPPELEFAAAPAEIDEGESSTLAWSCQRCGMLTVDLVNRNASRPGTLTVTPPFTMVYPASAWGIGSSSRTRVDKSVRVVVNPVGEGHVGCDGKVYETPAEAAATCVFTDCLGRPHPSQEEAEAVECFTDCLGGIHLSQGAALAVPCPFTDCGGGGHGTQAEADAVACFTDCGGRRIHLSQAEADGVPCFTDCAGREIHLSSAEAAAFHCDCSGAPHPTQAQADAVECRTHAACDGSLHDTQELADAVECETTGNDCEQAALDDGWGGSYPEGMDPPHCKAADSWETYTVEVEVPIRDEFGNVVYDPGTGRPLTQTVLEERRRKLPCENWLAPEAQERERVCTPCETAASPGTIPGTSEYSAARTWARSGLRGRTALHRAGASFSMRTSETDLAELYCELEGVYKRNLATLEGEIAMGVSGRLAFAGGVNTRSLPQRSLAVETVEDAQRLRNRRAGSIRNLGRASARLQAGLASGSGAVDWSQATATNRAQALAASQAEMARSAIDGEDRSTARTEAARYSGAGGDFVSGSALDAALAARDTGTGGRTLSSAAAAERRSAMANAAQSGAPAVEGLGAASLSSELSGMAGQSAGLAGEARSRNIGATDRWVRSADGRTVRDRIRDHEENMELPDPGLFRELWNRGAEGQHAPPPE